MEQNHSLKFLRQRKFFMMLPLLVIPFMTMAFYALGGGKGDNSLALQKQKTGFNIDLPGANLKNDKPLDKLSYYERADKDSVKLKDLMKNDPYYKQPLDTSLFKTGLPGKDSIVLGNYPFDARRLKTSPLSGNDPDPNEEKVYRKLNELNTALNNASATSQSKTNEDYTTNHSNNSSVNSTDIDRLENMMQTMNQSAGQDTEMKQLGSMMDKILDIQHPERVKNKLKEQSEKYKQQAFPVTSNVKGDNFSLLQSNHPVVYDTSKNAYGYSLQGSQNSFYSLDDNNINNDQQNAIQAVVHETQTLVTGSTVKLRLLNDIYVNGVLVPKGSFIFGTASLSGERLNIDITTLRYQNNILPVALSVYDLDGMAGIYMPGAIARDVAKQSADQSVQSFGGITTLDPSLAVQAASAGIEAAKTLFSRKIKLIKVTVKAGYQVLLKDNNQKNQ